jgi:hypothetical protein
MKKTGVDKFMFYYEQVTKELDALREKAENHFGVSPDDIDRSTLYKVRRTAELLRYVNRHWKE